MVARADRRRGVVSLNASVAGLLAGLTLLASACGGSSSPDVAVLGTARSTTTTAASEHGTSQDAAVAFSHCMRSHGVPNFPDPDAHGGFPSFHVTVPKQAARAADDACRHLLPRSGVGTPQGRQQKFTFALKVARCLRVHGYPTFPDPGASGQQIPPGIDTNSPQFQTVELRCEADARKALGVS